MSRWVGLMCVSAMVGCTFGTAPPAARHGELRGDVGELTDFEADAEASAWRDGDGTIRISLRGEQGSQDARVELRIEDSFRALVPAAEASELRAGSDVRASTATLVVRTDDDQARVRTSERETAIGPAPGLDADLTIHTVVAGRCPSYRPDSMEVTVSESNDPDYYDVAFTSFYDGQRFGGSLELSKDPEALPSSRRGRRYGSSG